MDISGNGQDESSLHGALFRGYNQLIRPVKSVNDSALKVSLLVQIIILISVNEKEQVLHSNVWLTLTWRDHQLTWNPIEYGGVEKIRIPVEKVWLPDIVLFNNADGNYEVSYPSNVVVSYDGKMLWVPPTLYKSSCIIDVLFFPFDMQECMFQFGSWTYSYKEVQFEFSNGISAVDLAEYRPSSVWDIIDCPAKPLTDKNDILVYKLVLRRKSLFYTVVLIVPSVLMALMSMMTFYLPTEAGEKISLATSILLSLVVFMLLVAKILPPSSKEIPLMAKYLLTVFILNVSTIATTVLVVNMYFRSPATHIMSPFTRWFFLVVMSKVFLLRGLRKHRRKPYFMNATEAFEMDTPMPEAVRKMGLTIENSPVSHHPHCLHSQRLQDHAEADQDMIRARTEQVRTWLPLTAEALKALEAVEYIAGNLQKKERLKQARQDWKYIALIIDRLFLYIFTGVTIGGTLGIILSAEDIFQQDEKSQVMHSNLWLTLKWTDHQMRWTPIEYGNVEKIRVPIDKVWLPDIVLFNNADGNYEVKYASNVVVSYTGDMLWVPPTLYQSSCIIRVEFFPFDDQLCDLNFGSWTYGANEVYFEFDKAAMLNIDEYRPSSIWDIIGVPAHYENPKKKDILKYQIRLRRKPLFYTVVLIIPSALMAIMSMMTFYLPQECGEKITLATSILLSLVVFMLLMVKILPPSAAIPLMAKYLLTVFILNVLTIAATVYMMNVYFRTPAFFSMSPWTRWFYFRLLASLLLMRRPGKKARPRYRPSLTNGEEEVELVRPPSFKSHKQPTYTHHPNCVHARAEQSDARSQWLPLTSEAHKAIEAVEFIADHLKRKVEDDNAAREWRYAALMVDRILMYAFTGVTIGGSILIVFSAPNIFHNYGDWERTKDILTLNNDPTVS